MVDVGNLRIDHAALTENARNRWRLVIGAVVAVMIVATVAGVAWLLRTPWQGAPTGLAGAHNGSAQSAAAPGGSNATSAPTANDGPRGFTAAGYVEVLPPGARVISSLIAGVLDEIHVQEGQTVRSGETIAVLDTSLLEQDLMRSQAEVEVLRTRLARLEAGYLPEEIAQAEARLQAATARLRIAEESRENHRDLAQRGIISPHLVLEAEVEVVEAVRSLAEAEADLAMKKRGARPEDIAIARAELARAQADLSHTHWKLDRCTITSPVDGVVFQQLAQPGQWIAIDSGESKGAASGAIMSIFDPGALQAWVDVNQRDLSRIHLGQRVTMIADAMPGTTIAGRVNQFMPRASIERNTVRIKIAIDGEHRELRPDMSLRVTFHDE